MRPRNTSYPLFHLCSLVRGQLRGNGDRTISGLCASDEPLPGHITFIRAQGAAAIRKAVQSLGSAAAFVQQDLAPELNEIGDASIILVEDPQSVFIDTISLFFEEPVLPPGTHPNALIAPSAVIDPSASVGAFCVIGEGVSIGANAVLHTGVTILEGSTIGASTVLHSGVVVRERCSIGANCIIHNNTVIGADGFGYTPDKKLGLRKVPQVGTVEVADNVEIGANTCIDRGAIGPTRIGRGTKIDNLVQVGHNVAIGSNCLVCGQVGIAGSVIIGDGVVLGGQVGVTDHIVIASGSRFGGGTSVTTNIYEKGDYAGYPIMSAGDWRRLAARVRPGSKSRSPDQKGTRGSLAGEPPNP